LAGSPLIGSRFFALPKSEDFFIFISWTISVELGTSLSRFTSVD